MMVSGHSDHKAYVYLPKDNFTLHQTITDSESDVWVTDLTGDGQFLLVIELEAKVRIYKNRNRLFSLFQTITPSDNSSEIYTGAITDDHEWVVFGTWEFHTIEVYKYNGERYVQNQTFSISYIPWHITITQDHSFLTIATNGSDVYVYKHNGSQRNLLQTFSYPSSFWKYALMTNDHQFLTVSDQSPDIVYRYSYHPID